MNDSRWRGGALAALSAAVLASTFPASADEYRVTFSRLAEADDGTLRRAHVEATLAPDGGRIKMTRAAADTGLPQGWAGFVRDLKAFDAQGRAVNVTQEPGGFWRIGPRAPGPVTLRYDVSLLHDRQPNDPGDDELAYARPYGVMWTTRALFMEGAPSKDIAVTFDLPVAWIVSTPWKRTAKDAWTFRPKDTDDLLEAAFMAGSHLELSWPMGEARAVIALGPPVRSFAPMFKDLVQTYFGAFSRLLADTPKDNFLLIGGDASFLGGGVIGRTISLSLTAEAKGPEGRAIASYIIAHEGFHLWNVRWQSDAASHADLEWLAEGAAEYYGLLTGLRTGMIDEAAFLNFVAQRYDAYLKALKSGQTLVAAAATKNSAQASYDLIYGGGMTVLVLADLEIRKATRGKRSLDDVVRALHARYAANTSQRLSLPALSAMFHSQAGHDFDAVVRNHIKGAAPIDLNDALKSVGLKTQTDAAGATAITPIATRTSEQAAAYAKWTVPTRYERGLHHARIRLLSTGRQ